MAPAIPVEFTRLKEPKRFLASEMIGKARRYSKGQAAGFVSNVQYGAVDMNESDVLGCSGGIDTEMTLSEDSCAPKRRCVSLIGDGYNSCGVPKQVVALSKMSMSGRKDLICRLKMDLERVQDLYKKLASMSSDIVLLSPHSDIHSCSDGPKRLPPESFARSAGSKGKKRGPSHNNMSRSKKGPSGRSETAKLGGAPASFSMGMVMQQCETLLNRLMSHKYGWPFISPVDPVKLNIPDYFTIIKRPMDLGTVKFRLCKEEYSCPSNFAADVRLTFSNAMTYNPPGNVYHSMAQTLCKYFETRWKSIEKKIPAMEPSSLPLNGTDYLNSDISVEILSKKKEVLVNRSKFRVEPAKLVMTDDDKKQIKRELMALEEEIPENIIDFLREQSTGDSQTGKDEIEIDIDALSDETLFQLRKLLDEHLMENKKSKEKGELCEIEIVHDSGLCSSLVQQSKGDGLIIDEDVDIVGGDSLPVSSCLIKVDQASTCGNNECTTSSSSSSESDSDCSTSSGSETASVKASNPSFAKDNEERGVDINIIEEGGKIEEIVKHPLNQLGNPTSINAEVPRDEESAPSERQLSPEKLYRAALLKNRFADTILKAREKALDKGEKGDPEKRRIEREEFEKRLREEKARLQAEAQAAEEARRKAEAEAAAKAKRQREEEREAARLALQKMEKTVDINENRQSLEDLERLKAAMTQGDELPSFMEETSPEYSQSMLGSFKMQGNTNPLEQLGLYMRMDEDDEDEEEDVHQPVSQSLPDDEQPADQKESDTQSFIFNQEEDEDDDHSLSRSKGGENLLNEEEQDDQVINKNQGGEQPHGWIDGCDRKLESASLEQENDAVDKGEQEEDDAGEGCDQQLENALLELENNAVDKGEQEEDDAREGCDRQLETGTLEQENDAVDKGEREEDDAGEGCDRNVESASLEQENNAVDKEEQEDDDDAGEG